MSFKNVWYGSQKTVSKHLNILTLALIHLALSKMRKNGRQPTSINILEEFQCLQEHTEETEQVCSYSEFLTTREMLWR